MIETTHRALTDLSNFNTSLRDKRQFVVTRSTFTGTNQFASYPIRSRYRTWESLRNSIPHVMSMNIFGFTHSGADACGTLDPASVNRTEVDEELCLRWIQLATFFPLARHSQNYNKNDSHVTGPLGFKEGPRMMALQKTMQDRMQYLRFMYTCLFEASQWGGSCFDPIYFHHSLDLKSMEDTTGANDTFIFGSAVKVSPIVRHLADNEKTFKSHFPKGRWLNLANWNVVETKTDGEVDLDATQETVNVHLRPGSIIPIQDLSTSMAPLNTTNDLMGMPISVVINRNDRKVAKGTVLLDDGISRSEIRDKTYEYYTLEHKSTKAIQFSLTQGKRGAQNERHHMDKIIIGDAEDLSETDFACAFTTKNEILELEVDYFSSNKTLKIFRPETFDDTRISFSQISNIFYG
jgi:alpha-glucosidase (family GH31 glycosyl hydrolase)